MGKQTDVSLPAKRRGEAMIRFAVLRPHIEEGVPLVRAAEAAGVPVRTARRWLACFRQDAINRFVVEHNESPKPFVWRADPDAITAARSRGLQALESVH